MTGLQRNIINHFRQLFFLSSHIPRPYFYSTTTTTELNDIKLDDKTKKTPLPKTEKTEESKQSKKFPIPAFINKYFLADKHEKLVMENKGESQFK